MPEDVDGPPLVGGNSGVVVRHGGTVRRPAGPWTPQVQRLMETLRQRGLTFVPRPLGLDDRGREVVEFVDGDVGVYPMPAWVWSDELLVDVAQALRQLHDVTAELALPRTGWRRAAVEPVQVVCHGDVAPFNTVCRDGRLAALIDWDYAVPAPRAWDLGYAAYRWVSLTAAGHPDGNQLSAADRDRRLKLFCDTYGDVLPVDVVRWAVTYLEDHVRLSRSSAAAGDPVFVATVAAGHADLYEADARWLVRTYGLT